MEAVKMGYAFIDTAYSYGTEKIVGMAIEKLLSNGYSRDHIFVQTKFSPQMPYDGYSLKAQFEQSLDNLRLEYVDSYLIHQPVPRYAELDYKKRNVNVWEEMESLFTDGRVKAIGVSNFLERHIMQILDYAVIPPMINQLEINPQYQQRGLTEFCKQKEICVQSWGTLSLTNQQAKQVVSNIADKHSVSSSQVSLKWNIQMGNVPICSSGNIGHLKSNISLDFVLDEEDMEAIRLCNTATDHRETYWYPRQQMY